MFSLVQKEKEERKRKEAEDKEKREREGAQKEELNKRKVEERARKAEEGEKRRTEIEKERARMAALKQNKGGSCKRPGPSTQQEATTSAQGDASGRTLRKRAKVSVDSTIFTDLCCVCFGSFGEDQGTGREWLQCLCTRWIHKDLHLPQCHQCHSVPYVDANSCDTHT